MKLFFGLVFFLGLSTQSAIAGDIRVDLASGMEDSHCSREQAIDQFHQALQSLKSVKATASQLLSYKEGDCRVHGLLRKTKDGFEFVQDYGLPGSRNRIMTFHSLDEIVALFSATQKSPSQSSSTQAGFSLPAPASAPVSNGGSALPATGFDQNPWGVK